MEAIKLKQVMVEQEKIQNQGHLSFYHKGKKRKPMGVCIF